MGNCFSISPISGDPVHATDLDNSDKSYYSVEKILERDKKLFTNRIIVLLLGAAESGKSTVLKQLRLNYGQMTFSQEELVNYRSLIVSNLVQISHEILCAAQKLDIQPSHPELFPQAIENFKKLLKERNTFTVKRDESIFPFILCIIKGVAQDPFLPTILTRVNDVTILDSVFYWFPNEIERVLEPGYIPTEKDILNSRQSTRGIREYDMLLEDKQLRIVDVGGAKSQRKQWLSVFSDVSTVIFIAAINGYCQRMRESPEIYRLQDSLALFDSVINNQFLVAKPFILFLNKIDLLKEYLKAVPLSQIYPDFEDENTPQEACKFILKKFLALNQNQKRYLSSHFTYATDRSQLEKILKSIKRILLKGQLQSLGLL